MTKVGRRNFKKSELLEMLHDADTRMQVLETALEQIAEKPSDDPAALHQIASTALEKAGESRSPVGLRAPGVGE